MYLETPYVASDPTNYVIICWWFYLQVQNYFTVEKSNINCNNYTISEWGFGWRSWKFLTASHFLVFVTCVWLVACVNSYYSMGRSHRLGCILHMLCDLRLTCDLCGQIWFKGLQAWSSVNLRACAVFTNTTSLNSMSILAVPRAVRISKCVDGCVHQ